MSDDPAICICGNIDRIGGSLPVHCSDCSIPLVISPGTYSDLPDGTLIVCATCGLKRMAAAERPELVMGPSQRAELLNRHKPHQESIN